VKINKQQTIAILILLIFQNCGSLELLQSPKKQNQDVTVSTISPLTNNEEKYLINDEQEEEGIQEINYIENEKPSSTIPKQVQESNNIVLDIINQKPASPTLTSLKTHIKQLEQAASNLQPIEIKYISGPTVVSEKVKLVMSRFQEKMKIYQLLGLNSIDIDWVIVSEVDYEWWINYRKSQDSDFPLDLWNINTNEFGHCKISADILCGAGNTVNGKIYQDNIIGTKFTNRGLDYVTQHEAAHFYQSVFGYGGRCWMAEGQATFFETYLETSSRSRNQVISRLLTSSAGIANFDEEKLITKMQDNTICDDDPNIAYDLGLLAFEYLYLNLSFKQVHELMVDSSVSSWEYTIKSLLGKSSSNFDKEIAQYIFSQLNI